MVFAEVMASSCYIIYGLHKMKLKISADRQKLTLPATNHARVPHRAGKTIRSNCSNSFVVSLNKQFSAGVLVATIAGLKSFYGLMAHVHSQLYVLL